MAFVGSIGGCSVRGRAATSQRTAVKCSRRCSVRMMSKFDDLAEQMAKELAGGTSSSTPGMNPFPGSTYSAPPVIVEGKGGLPSIVMHHAPSNQYVTIYLHGACVQSWRIGNYEALFTSEEAKWDKSKPIRAGIPICWPQFGPYGDLPTHGFARSTDWEPKDLEVLEDGSIYASMVISNETPSDLIQSWTENKKWEAIYAVTLSAGGLETALSVKNNGETPLEFTAAFHNYFKVSDISSVRIYGLDKTTYRDRLDSDNVRDVPDDMGQGTAITEETDRIYEKVNEELAVFDIGSLGLVQIEKNEGLPEATVWNPYGGKGSDGGWRKFICVEPAAITRPARVAPGETWVGAQRLGVQIN